MQDIYHLAGVTIMTTELTEKVIVTDKEDMTSMEQLNGHESRPQSMASNAVYKSRREIDKKVSYSLHSYDNNMGELSFPG